MVEKGYNMLDDHFTKSKNKSKLSIRESNKETEVAAFLHAELKESLYYKIKKQINLSL